MSFRLVQTVFKRLVYRTREYCVYASHSGQQIASDLGAVEKYDHDRPPPPELIQVYRRHLGMTGACLMFGRLKKAKAVFFCIREGGELSGVGWIQRWAPMRREFWWLADDAIALGPFWTNPDRRGRGVYGILLSAALAECRRRGWSEIYIWAERSNSASIRGIERADFRPRGTHRVTVAGLGLIRRHQSVRSG